MRAYITCPVSHSRRRLDLLPFIRGILDEKDIDSFVFEQGGTPQEIFVRDYSNLESSDLIIAEVSEPSHGVGAEIALAFSHGLGIILLLEQGKRLSSLIRRRGRGGGVFNALGSPCHVRATTPSILSYSRKTN